MRKSKRSAALIGILLVFLVPLMGIDCDETGEFIRGRESRTFAAAVVNQIATGILDAFIIAIIDVVLGVER